MFGIKAPKDIDHVVAKYNTMICPPGFSAITLFGVIFTRSKSIADRINKDDKVNSFTEYHEFIHIKQALSTNNSWLLFYLFYIWQWICNLPLLFVFSRAPYKFIPFEMEAYAFQRDLEHINKQGNKGCRVWKSYNKLSLVQKWEYAKQYKKTGGDFGTFLLSVLNKKEDIV